MAILFLNVILRMVSGLKRFAIGYVSLLLHVCRRQQDKNQLFKRKYRQEVWVKYRTARSMDLYLPLLFTLQVEHPGDIKTKVDVAIGPETGILRDKKLLYHTLCI